MIFSEEDSDDFVTDLSPGFRVNMKEKNRKEAERRSRFFILNLTVGVRKSSEDKLMLILSVQWRREDGRFTNIRYLKILTVLSGLFEHPASLSYLNINYN